MKCQHCKKEVDGVYYSDHPLAYDLWICRECLDYLENWHFEEKENV